MYVEGSIFSLFTVSGGQNKTFYISISKHLNWAAAFKYCEDRDMNLATFNSLEEATFFNNNVKYTVWVGVRDYQRDGKFSRVTDLKNIRDFLPWRPAQPSGNEFCVHTLDGDKFNDRSCNGLWRFACEAYN